MVKTGPYLNLTRSYNTATQGLRKNSMEMTTKFTSPMEPTEQTVIPLVKESLQVMAMTSLTLATTGAVLEHMEAEETILSTFQ